MNMPTISLFSIKLFVFVGMCSWNIKKPQLNSILHHTPVDCHFSSEFSFYLQFQGMASITGNQFVALSKEFMVLMRKKKEKVCYDSWQLPQSPQYCSVVEFKKGINVSTFSLKLIIFQIRLVFTFKQSYSSPVTLFWIATANQAN